MRIVITFSIVIILVFMCACNFGGKTGIVDKDHFEAKKMIEVVLEAIQSKDKEQIRVLFSKNALSQIQSFDISVDELFNYYDGTFKSYDDGAGPFVETVNNEERIYQLMESSFDVKTETTEYRFAIQYVTRGNENEVGLISLYIIKTNDDENLDYAYWGDGKFTPGIHIAIPNDI